MGILRNFEKRLEGMFERPFTRAFRSGVHPLEIARRLMREIDDGKALGIEETLVPNRYLVSLSPEDHERLSGYLGSLASELESLAITYINRQGYHLVTRPRLAFASDDRLKEGEFSILATLEEAAGARSPAGSGESAPAAEQAEGLLGALAVIGGEEAGRSYRLHGAKSSIGRSEENDLVLVDPRVSRFHAEVERTPRGYIIRDLGSTNGTRLKGRPIQERLLEEGDVLTLGDTEMRFGLVSEPRRS